jgi:hypothetical protein
VRGEGERPFRITFHASGLANLPEVEAKALEALRELSHLGDIDALTIDGGMSPLRRPGAEATMPLRGRDVVQHHLSIPT